VTRNGASCGMLIVRRPRYWRG